ncbi:MAG: hypothetical protein NVS4B8_23690 [Herpetosiphon sp.]
MRSMFLTAALLISGGVAYAKAPPSVIPCEAMNPDMFMDFVKPGSGLVILDVGGIVKEPGDNICSIVMDTSESRVRMTFTTFASISGATLIRRLSVRVIYGGRT